MGYFDFKLLYFRFGKEKKRENDGKEKKKEKEKFLVKLFSFHFF